MNLKNNQITIKELLEHPAARALLNKRFPMALRHPLAKPAQNLTLAQAIEFARAYLSQKTIQEILEDLKKI